MTVVRACFPVWLFFIGLRPLVYNPYLRLLSLLFLGISLAIFSLILFNFGQYVIVLQLFINEVAFYSMTL